MLRPFITLVHEHLKGYLTDEVMLSMHSLAPGQQPQAMAEGQAAQQQQGGEQKEQGAQAQAQAQAQVQVQAQADAMARMEDAFTVRMRKTLTAVAVQQTAGTVSFVCGSQ